MESEEQKFNKEEFILLSKEKQIEFIKNKVDFLVQQVKEGLETAQKKDSELTYS